MNKSIFKKWWFWVGAVIFLWLFNLAFGDQVSTPADTTTASNEAAQPSVTEPAVAEPEKAEEPTQDKEQPLPGFKVVEERLDKSGMWYLTISTDADNEADLQALVKNARQLAVDKNEGVTSVFVYVEKNGESGNIATGKLALSDKGLAQTGLKDTSEVEFELIKVPGKTETPATETKKEETKPVADASAWAEEIKKVANGAGSETEKADSVEQFARDYKPAPDELKSFQTRIVDEYVSGNYLKEPTNAEYMLTNLFAAVVVERNALDAQPIKAYAFDFYQNTKYVYRGVDAPDSDSVKSNEDQMNKALNGN